MASATERRPLTWTRWEVAARPKVTSMPIPIKDKDPSQKTTQEPPTVRQTGACIAGPHAVAP